MSEVVSDTGSEHQREYGRAKDAFATNERVAVDRAWDEISEFILPNQSGLFNSSNTAPSLQSPGEKKTRRVYDLTAIQACHDLGASIHSTLTSPSMKWSRIRFKNEALNNDSTAVAWLESVNDTIHRSFNESNFDTEASRNYLSYPALGTMVLFHEVVDDTTLSFTGFNFKAVHLSEIAYEEGKQGIVDRVYRRFEMTGEAVLEKFGNKVSEKLQIEIEKAPTKKVIILHTVYPRKGDDVSSETGTSATKRPFASMFFEASTGQFLDEGGYYEMPYYVTRWSLMAGEIYGRSPGHIAIGDVRSMNTMIKLHLESIAMSVSPPLLAERNNILGDLNLRPKKLNIVHNIKGIAEFVTRADHHVAESTTIKYEERINKAFFLDKLMLPPRTETGEMTAFEVAQRLQQMQKVLGSILGRLNSEFLSPLIIRSFKMLLRGGFLPDLPPVLREGGIDVDISFINGLAQAQQIEDVTNIQRWVQALGELAAIKPEAVDYIDADGIARHLADSLFVPEAAVKNDDEVRALREQRAQQQQAQAALDAGQQVSEIAKNVPEEEE